MIYGDSFGYLATQIKAKSICIAVDGAAQKGAIIKNLEDNKVKSPVTFITLTEETPEKCAIAFIKIPKSLEQFELFLHHFMHNASQDSEIVCGFMTRHFSKQLVSICEDYFEEVSQSLAWKKARLLICKKGKKLEKKTLINTISFNNEPISQHYGVFSSNSIDAATQLLMAQIKTVEDETKVMDLGCGNGIIGLHLMKLNDTIDLHLVDDSFMAVESAKLNIQNATFHHAYNLDSFSDNSFDLIVTNPPFHVGHEIDISVPIRLFKEAHDKLKVGGLFYVVANNHLNYKTHLSKLFKEIEVAEDNEKFTTYKCCKT